MLSKHRTLRQLAAPTMALTLLLSACGSSDAGSEPTADEPTGAASSLSDEQALTAATAYADLVHDSYQEVADAAVALQDDIVTFVAEPTQANLDAAKAQWLTARDAYGPTEAFRFYDGPIDNAEDGPEGQINAWPMDEAYVDYVAEDPTAGIINDTEGVPEITIDEIVAANEEGGETNISTGWHAIEFLLWGQDTSDTGPGERPVTDYTTAENASRRAQYLTEVTGLLVDDLSGLVEQWDAADGDYRSEFLADPQQAVSNILRGMGALSSGELAGERIAVAYETKSQEDEHSCFSDNTMADVINNASGIRDAYAPLSEAVAAVDADLDAAMTAQLDATVAAAEELGGQGTFEEIIQSDNDSDERAQMLALIEALQAQGDAIAELGAALGYEISLEI